MIFSRGKLRKHRNFLFGGHILDITYEYVYLGVNFSYSTSFIKAIERHISRAKRAMFAIVTKSRRLSLPLYIYCLSYFIELSYLAVVLYASEIYFQVFQVFIDLMATNNLKDLRNLAKFATIIFRKFH